MFKRQECVGRKSRTRKCVREAKVQMDENPQEVNSSKNDQRTKRISIPISGKSIV